MIDNIIPTLIQGNFHTDERGTVSFINDFDMSCIKRMYTIKHHSTNTIRAWQAHKIEAKYFKCIAGSFSISAIKIDNFEKPSNKLKQEKFLLTDSEQEILSIPKGYANGFQALQKNSELLVFSSLSLELAKADQYKFEEKSWIKFTL